MNGFIELLSANGVIPHGSNYQWHPGLLWLQAISDSLIALAFFLILIALIYFVRSRRNIPFGWMFAGFCLFITASGAMHVMDVWTVWIPSNWFSAGVKVITALTSIPTAIFLVRLMPAALSLAGAAEMLTANEQLKRQSATLKESEGRFRQMVENAQEIFWMIDTETKAVIYASPALEQICELPLDSLYSDPTSYRKLIHPEDLKRVLRELDRLEDTNRVDEEFRIICPSGTVKWLRAIGFKAKDSAGDVPTFVGTAQEITTRKKLEAILRESEDRYRDLVEHSTDLMCTYNLQGELLSVNELPAKLLGYSREELLNKPMRNFLLPKARAQFDESLLRVQRDGFVTGLMVVLSKTGERRIWEYHNTLRTEGVTVPIVRGIAHDITDQKRMEKALRLSEDKFAKAFHSSPIEMVITTFEEGRFLDVNEAFERNAGFNRDELIGRTSIELGIWEHPDHRETIIEQIKLHGKLRNQEIGIRTKAGNVRLKRYSAEQIEVGGRQCLLAAGEDITSRKQMEEALWVSQEIFSKAFRSSPSLISITTLQKGLFLEVNESFEKRTGYSRDELLGHTALDIGLWVDPGERETLEKGVVEHGYARDQEVHFRTKSGQVVVLQISVEMIDLRGEKCLLTVGQNITEHRKAEEALRKNEAQFSAILNHSPSMIFLKNIEGRYLFINKEYRKTFQFYSDEIYGKTDMEIFPSDQAALFRGSDLQVLTTRAPIEFEEVALRADGPHTSIVQKFPLFDARGELYAICGLVTDITERKRSEERLREYERAVEGVEEMIAVVDRKYQYLLANRAFINFRSLRRDQVVGRLVPEVIDKNVFEREIKEKIDESFQGKIVRYELNYTYPELGQRDIQVSYFPIEGAVGVDRVVCVLQDITERKRAEAELRRLSGQLLKLQDEERRRISRDLHDSTGQDLVALATNLSQLHSSIPSSSKKTRKLASHCEALANRCLYDVRTLSYLLHPAMLDETGLEDAIHHYADGFADRTGIEVELSISPHSERMAPDIELALFRVVQESLTNIQRHSASLNAKIRLDRQAGMVSLEVSDKGHGTSGKTVERNGGIPFKVGVGIPSMQERVKLIGGQLDIVSSHSGTTVRVAVPLPS
jgi:PAS domain S-box-containing protein